jgi:GntR family transcriptional regulator / MocR family aminotransferase
VKSKTNRISPGFFPPIDVEADQPGPIYRKLYNWFREGIVSGRLRPGQRVPSSRELVSELKISRSTVLAAFQQLHAEGYLQGAHGSGTYVAKSIPEQVMRSATKDSRSSNQRARCEGARRLSRPAAHLLSLRTPPLTLAHRSELGAFRVGLPALDHFPFATWSRLVARHWRQPKTEMMTYGDPMGYLPCREAIAEYLGVVRGVTCEASQVMIVSGSQQGLALTARVLLDTGDSVWTEEPGYLGGLRVFTAAGARLVPIPVDSQGLDVKAGIHRCREARAAFISPSHQFPMGKTMSFARRMLLLDWAARNGSWIIEDDHDSDYRFSTRPIGSLQGLDVNGRVIYVGTFSKILFPSLRIGYLVLPNDLVPAFTLVRFAFDIFPSTLNQAILADFIREGHLARHIRRMRMVYMNRREILSKEIRQRLGTSVEIVNSKAGFHAVILLPGGIQDQAVSNEAAKAGVAVLPLSICYQGHPGMQGLILGYGGVNQKQIQDGVSKLTAVIQGCSKRMISTREF